MPEQFYDHLAGDYERMTEEPARLRREIPFLVQEIRQINGNEVLDVGCATGGHVRALAAEGYRVFGIDTSSAMIEKAQAGPPVQGASFELASVADLAERTVRKFDVAICLGNTMPHLVTEETSLAKISRQIAPLLRRDGLLIGQVVNVPWVEATGVRLLPLRSWTDKDEEVILTRHYLNTAGTTVLMVVTRLARRPGEAAWRVDTFHQHLLKIVPMELERAFDSGPWSNYRCYGGWEGESLNDSRPSIIFITTRR